MKNWEDHIRTGIWGVYGHEDPIANPERALKVLFQVIAGPNGELGLAWVNTGVIAQFMSADGLVNALNRRDARPLTRKEFDFLMNRMDNSNFIPSEDLT